MAKKRICSVSGCNKPHEARGYCGAHYLRWWKHGDALVGIPTREPRTPNGEASIFLETIVLPFREIGCLHWPYSTLNGYGRVRYKGKTTYVHRLVCRLTHGEPKQEFLHAAHSCGNSICCNPTHIRWASPKENQSDRVTHGTSLLGADGPGARLSEEDVRLIRLMKGSMSYSSIGRIFGVTASTAHRAATGRTWSALD